MIVAEDGVTSLRYYVSVLREGGSDAAIVTANSLENLWDGGPSSAPYGSLDNSSLLISNPGQLIAPPPPLITSEWQTGECSMDVWKFSPEKSRKGLEEGLRHLAFLTLEKHGSKPFKSMSSYPMISIKVDS